MSGAYKKERDRIAGHVLSELYPGYFDKPDLDRNKKHEIQLHDRTGRYMIQAITDPDNGVSDDDRAKVADTLGGMIANINVGAKTPAIARKNTEDVFKGTTVKQWQMLFQSMRRYGFTDKLIKGFTLKPRVMPQAATTAFKSWASNEGLDLDAPVLPSSSLNDQANHQQTAFFRFKAKTYSSDDCGQELDKIAHYSLFPMEPLSDGWQERLEDRLEKVDVKSSNILRTNLPDAPNHDLADKNIYVDYLYDALDPSFSVAERKALLSFYLLQNMVVSGNSDLSFSQEQRLWHEAFHAAPEHFRNDFFKALHETDLLLPFYVIAQRKDAYVDSYAIKACEDWAHDNNVSLIEDFVNHVSLTTEDRDGEIYIREVPNSEVQSIVAAHATDPIKADLDALIAAKQAYFEDDSLYIFEASLPRIASAMGANINAANAHAQKMLRSELGLDSMRFTDRVPTSNSIKTNFIFVQFLGLSASETITNSLKKASRKTSPEKRARIWNDILTNNEKRLELYGYAEKYDLIAPLYFLLSMKTTNAPSGSDFALEQWCEDQEIDLRAKLIEYEIPDARFAEWKVERDTQMRAGEAENSLVQPVGISSEFRDDLISIADRLRKADQDASVAPLWNEFADLPQKYGFEFRDSTHVFLNAKPSMADAHMLFNEFIFGFNRQFINQIQNANVTGSASEEKIRQTQESNNRQLRKQGNKKITAILDRLYGYGLTDALDGVIHDTEKMFMPPILVERYDWWKKNKLPVLEAAQAPPVADVSNVNPELIKKLEDHYEAYIDGTLFPRRLNSIYEEFGLDHVGITSTINAATGEVTTTGDRPQTPAEVITSLYQHVTSVSDNPTQDAMNLYIELIHSPRKRVYENIRAGLKIGGTQLKARDEKQKYEQLFGGRLSAEQMHSIFERINQHGLASMFERNLEGKGEDGTHLPHSLKRKYFKWKAEVHMAPVGAASENRSGAANPDLITALLDVSKRLDEGELALDNAATATKDVAVKFGLTLLPDEDAALTGAVADIKSARDKNIAINHLRQRTRQIIKTRSAKTSLDQDAYNLYSGLIVTNRHDVAEACSSDPEVFARLKRDVAKHYKTFGVTDLQGIFARLEDASPALLADFARGFGKDAEYETILPKEIGKKLEKWQELMARRASREAEATENDVASSANPELVTELLSLTAQLDDESLGSASFTDKLIEVSEKFDLSLSATVLRKKTVKSQWVKPTADISDIEKVEVTARKETIKSTESDSDQDCFNLFTNLIAMTREDICSLYAHDQTTPAQAESKEAGLGYIRRNERKFYNSQPITAIYGMFDRLDSYGLLDEFARGFGKDAEYKTTLPKELGQKLQKWKVLQARKLETEQGKPTANSSDAAPLSGGGEGDVLPSPVDLKDRVVDAAVARKQAWFDGLGRDEFDAWITSYVPKGLNSEILMRIANLSSQKTDHVELLLEQFRCIDQFRDSGSLGSSPNDTASAFYLHYLSVLIERNPLSIKPIQDVIDGSDALIEKSVDQSWLRLFKNQKAREELYGRCADLGMLPIVYLLINSKDTKAPDRANEFFEKWCAEQKPAIDIKRLVADFAVPDLKAKPQAAAPTPDKPVQKLSKPKKGWKKNVTPTFEATGGDEGYVQARRNKIAERDAKEREEVGPKLSEPKEGWEKVLSLAFVNAGGGDEGYVQARRNLIAQHNKKFPLDEDYLAQTPYDATDNDDRDIPRIYVPGLLPEGKGDHDEPGELTGNFVPATGKPRGPRKVTIQEERRDLIVEALKLNPDIDNSTIREYTHPEFDTEEGRYYTVIHAETFDGNWTQVAVSTAQGDGIFFDKHRQIVDPMTGRSRLGISDLREDLMIQRVKFHEGHHENYKNRVNEIFTMSPDDVPENTKTAIQWAKLQKYGNKVANQIHNSLAAYIREFGEEVDKSKGVIKTGEMRFNPDEEHPSLIYRTTWARVFWALSEEKVTGMEHVKTKKQLLHWAVEKDPTLWDCLREDVQEWLSEPDEEYEPPVTITSAEEALEGKEPANDMFDLEGRKYTREELEEILRRGLE